MSVDLTTGIVRILNPDGTTVGTGFVLADGIVATCAHVIKNGVGVGPGGIVHLVFHITSDEATALVEPDGWRDPDAEDVAILRLDGPLPQGVKPLPLGLAQGCKGHPFVSFGFPAIGSQKEAHIGGTIEGLLQDGGVLQITSEQISPGVSGAPVFDTHIQCVVGIISEFPAWEDSNRRVIAGDPYGRHTKTNFAIPTEALLKVWRLELSPPLEMSPSEVLRSYCDLVAMDLKYLKVNAVPIYEGKELIKYEKEIKLDDIFVPLNITPSAAVSDVVQDWENTQSSIEMSHSKDEMKWMERQIGKDKPIVINRALNRGRHMVILGQPGAGKTTLLQYLALVYASGMAEERLFVDEDLVPIYLPLSEVRDASFEYLDDVLFRHATRLVPDLHHATLVQTLREAILQGKVLFLLDALDETYEKRSAFTKDIGSFSNRPEIKRNRLIVTSRIDGYSRIVNPDLRHYTLQELTVTNKERFIYKWFKALAEARGDTIQEAEDWAEERAGWLLTEIRRLNLEGLTETPLHLVMFIVLSQKDTELPTDDVELYRYYLKEFLELHTKWEEDKGHEVEEPVGFLGALEVLYEAAYTLYRLYDEEIPPTLENVCHSVNHRLLGLFSPARGKNLERIRRTLKFWNIAGLLTHDAKIDRLGFRHTVFQDYGAACVLAADAEERRKMKQTFFVRNRKRWEGILELIPALIPYRRQSFRR